MIVVESGGTKSTWMFSDNQGDVQVVETVGLHPREINTDKQNEIHELVANYQLANRQVYFFGAGCESEEAKGKIYTFLSNNQLKVKQVETDIYAACIAHLGNQPGVVGIIGTGAVAAQFNGIKVEKITSGWGYILGDEGSGFDLGKRLLQLYLKDELFQDIKNEIDDYFNHKSILHRVYAPDGRKYVAGLTKIIFKYRSHSIISKLIQDSFSDFCDTALKTLYITDKVHFVGSVAYFFSEELKEALNKKGYKLGNIHQAAIEKVYSFLVGLKCENGL